MVRYTKLKHYWRDTPLQSTSFETTLPASAPLNRRHFLQWLAATGMVWATVGCGDKGQQLIVASGIWQGYELMFLAKRQGWLKKPLVRLAELPSNSSSLHALASGLVHGAALTLDEVLRARVSGIPLTIVLVFNSSAGADMVLAKPEIADLAQLKKQRVAIDQGTNSVVLLAKALQSAGLTAADVTIVTLPIGAQVEAWNKNQIDAAITYDPVASQLQALGAKRLFDSSQVPDTIVDVLALRSEFLIPEYAEAIRHLIASHFRALHFFQQDPLVAAPLIAEHLGLTPEDVPASYAGLQLPDITENRRLLAGSAPVLMQSAARLVAFMTEQRLLPSPDPLTQLVTADYLPSAI